MKLLVASLLASLACALAAQAATPKKPPFDWGEMLEAAFPQWHSSRDASGKRLDQAIASIDLPSVTWPWRSTGLRSDPGAAQATLVRVQPFWAFRVDPEHVALFTRALPVGDHRSAACQGERCTVAIGVYVFEQAGDDWKLSWHQDVASVLTGSAWGLAGPQDWTGHGIVMGTSMTDCGATRCNRHLSLLGVTGSHLAFSYALNDGNFMQEPNGFPLCTMLLSGGIEPVVEPDRYANRRCSDARQTWRLRGDEITLDITERQRIGSAEGRMGAIETNKRKVTLALHDGSVAVTEGSPLQDQPETPYKGTPAPASAAR